MRTRPVSAAQIRAYAGKAQEFAAAAISELAAGRFIAASSLAVHAGINAADAVCGASVLAAASLAVQGLADVTIDGRTHPLTLWMLTVAESGERRTPSGVPGIAPKA